jgi:long-chain fatty acid transport protein
MKKLGLLSLAATTALMASGYKIPEQSQKSVALSAANVAHAHGADAAYENPANMAFETGNGAFEMSLAYIHLTDTKFEGTVTSLGTPDTSGATSKKENFIIPTFYYVSPAVDDFHFGLAFVSPVGLTKRWDEQPAKGLAEEFSLMTYEVNPTVAYKVNDQFAIAAGLRMIYADGTVKSSAPATSLFATRNMEGDTLEFGYNLAVTYKATPELELAATYRSKIDLDVEGHATLSNIAFGPYTAGSYSGPVSVSVPAPATLNLAAAYTFDQTTTVEAVFERTYWSAYKNLDFEYNGDKSNFSPFLTTVFDDSRDKNWKDVNSYRLGLTHKYDADLTLMAGTVFFDTPMPEATLGFEHPDSKGWAYSGGFRYKLSKEYEVGASFLYADRENRTVNNTNVGTQIDGTFSNTKVYYLSLGIEYKF